MKLAALLLMILSTPAFAEEPASTTSLQPRPVVSEVINPQFSDPTVYVGIVAARAETDLGFPLNGTIAVRLVDKGHLVSKGDVLARLNPEDLDSDVRAAEAGVDVATAQLRTARDAEQRARELSARGVDSATKVEDTQRALTAAEAKLEQAQASLARAQDMRSFATLLAPQDGAIIEVFAEPGATITAGEPVVRLAETGAREIVIDLTEQDVANLEIGTAFTAGLVSSTDVTAQATLTRVDPVAERTTRTRRLHLTLSDPPLSFRLGALVRVSVADSSEAIVSVESTAILDREGTPAVWIVDRNTNTVSRTLITLGARFGQRERVTSGLTAGDEVIVKGINSLQDGQIVGRRVTP